MNTKYISIKNLRSIFEDDDIDIYKDERLNEIKNHLENSINTIEISINLLKKILIVSSKYQIISSICDEFIRLQIILNHCTTMITSGVINGILRKLIAVIDKEDGIALRSNLQIIFANYETKNYNDINFIIKNNYSYLHRLYIWHQKVINILTSEHGENLGFKVFADLEQFLISGENIKLKAKTKLKMAEDIISIHRLLYAVTKNVFDDRIKEISEKIGIDELSSFHYTDDEKKCWEFAGYIFQDDDATLKILNFLDFCEEHYENDFSRIEEVFRKDGVNNQQSFISIINSEIKDSPILTTGKINYNGKN